MTCNYLPKSLNPQIEMRSIDDDALKERVHILEFEGQIPDRHNVDAKERNICCGTCMARWLLGTSGCKGKRLELQLEAATADLEKAVRKVLNARKTIGEHDGKRLPEAEELFDKIVDEVKRVSLEELPFVMTDEKRAEIAAKRKAAQERLAAKRARTADGAAPAAAPAVDPVAPSTTANDADVEPFVYDIPVREVPVSVYWYTGIGIPVTR